VVNSAALPLDVARPAGRSRL